MNEQDRSKAHEADALSFNEVGNQAGAAMARAAGASEHDPDLAEATALFQVAYAQAHMHATLSVAAAVRELAEVVDNMRRMMP